eukprot:GHRR01030191.1.p1 GENE.GHRR01030191.1~~GHRR01030191.1.p1  ORF type:complete len:103 (-),score=16.00 GHRR01030191.1:447-755(-)
MSNHVSNRSAMCLAWLFLLSDILLTSHWVADPTFICRRIMKSLQANKAVWSGDMKHNSQDVRATSRLLALALAAINAKEVNYAYDAAPLDKACYTCDAELTS